MRGGFGFLLLVILLGLVFWQYNDPQGSKELIDKGVNTVKDKMGGSVDNTPSCSQEAVCFNNVIFESECMAIENGITGYTLGECQ